MELDTATALDRPNDLDAIGVALRVARAVEACEGAYLVDSLEDGCATFVLNLPIGAVNRFAAELGRDFEVGAEKALRDALLLGHTRRILFVPSALAIELVALGRSEFDDVEFARRRRVTVRASGETLVVKSAEDGLLRKLLEFSGQGLVSQEDWQDVVALLAAGAGALDFTHLEQWAARLGVAEMLEQARSESATIHLAR